MTLERKAQLARQLVAIIFELTSAGEVPTDVMPVEQPKKPVEMLTCPSGQDKKCEMWCGRSRKDSHSKE